MRPFVPLSIAAVIALDATLARAQSEDAGAGGFSAPPVVQPETGVTPPSLRTRVEAIYPPEALRDRIEGTVGVEAVVDETGAVTDARVIAPAGHGFNEAALAAVRQFTFEPARKGSVAVRSTVQLAYEFHLPPPAPSAAAPPASVQPAPPVPPPTAGESTRG